MAGLRPVKRLLIRRIRRVLTGRDARVPAEHHLLFYGPPGCGKSLLARAVAGELGARFTQLDAAALSRIDPSEWSRAGGPLEPSTSPALRLIFIDGLDALPAAQAAGLASALSLPISNRSPVLVVAATERLADVAPVLRTGTAFPEPIFVGPPRRAARMLIFARQLQGRASCTVSLKQLAVCTPGLTGADIVSICRRANEQVQIETLDGDRPRPIEMIDLVVQNAVTPRILPDWRREQLGLRKRRR